MLQPARTLSIVLLLAALTFAASQGGMGPGPTTMRGGMGMGPGMMSGPTITTDVHSFLRHMIPHHEEAIVSAEALLAVTERPELQVLLQDIIETQRDEVERMRGWIGAWYPDADPTISFEPMMRDLGDAPVAELERAWLEDMILHHMMAVHEARALLMLDTSAHPDVADLANDIIAGQMAEMRRMVGWLSEWFDVDAMDAMRGAGPMGAGPMGRTMPGMGRAADRAGIDEMHRSGRGANPAGRGMMQHGPAMMQRGPGGMARVHTDPRDVAEALARAFLAGRGGDAVVVEVTGPRVTFEVTYRDGDTEGVLVIDALSGDVVESPAR